MTPSRDARSSLTALQGTHITTYLRRQPLALARPDDRLLFEGLTAIPAFSGEPAFFYFHLMSTHVIGIRQDRHLVYRPSYTRTTSALYAGESREMRVKQLRQWCEGGTKSSSASRCCL